MKKSLIVLSILASVAGAAHAENKTVLYGSLGYSVGFQGKSGTNAVKDFKKNNWDLRTNKARFGIKGQEDINDSLTAIYHLEFDADKDVIEDKDFGFADVGKALTPDQAAQVKEGQEALAKKLNGGVNKTSKAYLGLKGGFGEVTFGNQGAAYGDAVNFNDTFNELGAYDGRKIANFSKGIKYKTPNTIGGFEVTTTINVDGDDKASKGVDLWEVAAVYDANNIKAGLGYQKKVKGREVMGTSVGYKNDAFQAGIGYVHEAKVGNFYNVGGEVYSGPNTFRAGVAYADHKKNSDDKWTGALGYQYNFSERTYSWVEGQYDHKKEGNDKNEYQVVVGVRHDF